ncbi:hypothetical protein KNP414_02213 [Paenibacillus mucilaginosus KNP414]|uniref:Uncharacterized protein n=1 Tax=Paenibacillus mucilaginosus (strain KNP414) TaxID=1036673 RepID=F8F544_PAEMK|nr:hypothetical protein KNP414_02213 [Paenibacillus mucilaginosus KNP414]
MRNRRRTTSYIKVYEAAGRIGGLFGVGLFSQQYLMMPRLTVRGYFCKMKQFIAVLIMGCAKKREELTN